VRQSIFFIGRTNEALMVGQWGLSRSFFFGVVFTHLRIRPYVVQAHGVVCQAFCVLKQKVIVFLVRTYNLK
jgi:hypothetical protein